MKIIRISVLGFLLLASPIVNAQQHKKDNVEVKNNTENDLGLTSEQQTKLTEIRNRYKVQFVALKEDSTKTQEDKDKASKALRSSMRKELDAVLTPAQLEQRKSQKVQDRTKGHQQKMAPHKFYAKEMTKEERIVGKVTRLDQVVGLSKSQKEKVTSIYSKYADLRLDAEKETVSANKDKLREKERNEIKKVLTKEQIRLWDEHKTQRKTQKASTTKPKNK